MLRSVLRHALLAAGILVGSHAAFAENRVALVIGQSNYHSVVALPNPANDARAMSRLLGDAGFDVTSTADLSQNEMREKVSDFAAKVAAKGPDTVALVFYAGHGLQIDGENYLVPVDVDPKREADIPLQAVRLNDLMNTLGALPTKMRIVMLDACRNNPFPALSGTTGHGLALVDTKAGASGTFISYSTSPGAEAEDGNGDDSPYTMAVLSVAKEPNLPIEEAFKRVRVAVNQATDGRQIPWESSSLTADFKFFATDTAQQAASPPKPAEPNTLVPEAQRVEVWHRTLQGKEPKAAYDLVIADDSVAAYEAFAALYSQTPYGSRVRSLLERRRQMIAWANAVAINTAPAFAAFLASYPIGDLAATARTMAERVRNRTIVAPAVAPTTVALGPTCPCTTPNLPTTPTLLPAKKRAEEPPPKKRVEKSAAKRKPPPDDVVVEGRPPPEQGVPPGAVMEGVGIGFGLELYVAAVTASINFHGRFPGIP